MIDPIDRQAAIDGTKKIPDLSVYAYCSFLDMLSKLPSAEPKDYECWGCNCQKMKAQLSEEDATKGTTFDYIERQAAIDAMEESKTIYHDRKVIIGKMQDIVNNLPPVQEHGRKLAEWCTDCKEYDQERHCCPRFNRVIRETLDEVKANLPSAQPENMCVNLDIQKIATHKSDFSDLDELPSVQEWIPVTERLPETDDYVLVTCRRHSFDGKGKMRESYFVSMGLYQNGWSPSSLLITAWMPLPEPYEGERTDEAD